MHLVSWVKKCYIYTTQLERLIWAGVTTGLHYVKTPYNNEVRINTCFPSSCVKAALSSWLSKCQQWQAPFLFIPFHCCCGRSLLSTSLHRCLHFNEPWLQNFLYHVMIYAPSTKWWRLVVFFALIPVWLWMCCHSLSSRIPQGISGLNACIPVPPVNWAGMRGLWFSHTVVLG